MDFGKILKDAWKTLWQHKVIFYFGFLMTLPSIFMTVVMGGAFFFITEENLDAFFESAEVSPIFFILYFLSVFFFIIFSYAMTALSFAGVFKGTFALKDTEEKISFRELWGISLPYVGRILGLFFLAFFALFFLVMLPMFLIFFVGILTAGVGMLCLFPLIFLIIPLELIGYLFMSLAMGAIIAENLGVFEAIRRAWEVLKGKFWLLILMTIILLFLQWALNMIIMVPIQSFQMAFFFSADFMNSADLDAFFRPFAIFILFFMPIIAIVQSLGFTYANAAWMFTYLDVTAPEQDEILAES